MELKGQQNKKGSFWHGAPAGEPLLLTAPIPALKYVLCNSAVV